MAKKRDFTRVNTLRGFLTEERAITVYPVFMDYIGELKATYLFSQIYFWYLPKKENESQGKLRVWKKDKGDNEYYFWIAKTNEEWQDEIKLSKKEIIGAIKRLEEKKLIKKQVMKFNGETVTHIRMVEENLEEMLKTLEEKGNKPTIIKESDEKEKSEVPKGAFQEEEGQKNKHLPELVAKLGVLKYPPLKHTLDILTSNVKLTDNLHKLAHDGKTQSQAKLFIAFMNKQARVPKKEEFDLLIELKDTYQPKQLEKALKDIGKVENISTMKKEIEEIATKEKENTENKYVPKKMYQKPEKKQTVDSFSEYDLEALN